MKINFLSDNKVEVELEVEAIYKRPAKERKIYKTDFVIKEFNKIYPKKTIVNVLSISQLDNFTAHELKKGTWVFEVTDQCAEPIRCSDAKDYLADQLNPPSERSLLSKAQLTAPAPPKKTASKKRRKKTSKSSAEE